jgi:TM2 domain-containing membrane protein YozV
VGDWYYIGHYGQLGPLTRDQVDELVVGGVIVRETYVWRDGMTDWISAEKCVELQQAFRMAAPAEPPPRPGPPATTATAAAMGGQAFKQNPAPMWVSSPVPIVPTNQPIFTTLKSDRSRAAAGILQLLLPGVGRMYLGYLAYGVLQLALFFVTCGLLYLWSFIDGIIILTGGVKLDGYGRQLSD